MCRPRPPGLVRALAGRELLVVLDNCEHVLEAAADLVATLLAQCRRLRFLATSRERLDVPGELVFPVPPLGLPADGSAAAVAASEAGPLFAAPAGAASPAFELSAHNSAAVAQMCARLDGIPLAIELAAARCPALGPAELAARLDGHPGLLSGGPARPGQSPGVWWWRLPGSQDARSGSSRSGEPAACFPLTACRLLWQTSDTQTTGYLLSGSRCCRRAEQPQTRGGGQAGWTCPRTFPARI